MNLFFKKIIYFSFLLISVVLIFISFYYFQFKSRLIFSDNIQTVILGDSRTQNGLNDNIINNSINYSNSAEPLILSHAKLRYIINNNSQIENVILSLHSFTLTEKSQLAWLGPENIFDKFGSIFPAYNFDDYSQFYNEFGGSGFINVLHSITYYSIFSVEKKIINIFSTNINNTDLFIGGYTPNNKIMNSFEEPTDQPSNNLELNDMFSDNYSQIQLSYLKKIITICEKNSINLLLVNTPIYKKKHKQKIPFEFFDKEKFEYLDLSELPLDYSFFADRSHLNPKGADSLSLIINSKINEP